MGCEEVVVVSLSFIGCSIFIGHGIRTCLFNNDMNKIDIEPVESISIDR